MCKCSSARAGLRNSAEPRVICGVSFRQIFWLMLMRQDPLIGGRLLESAAIPTRRRWPLAISTVLHGALISGAIVATLVPKMQRRDDVPMVELAVYHAPPVANVPSAAARPTQPKGFQVLVAPPEVPSTITAAALPATNLRAEDFSGRGVLGGIAAGVVASEVASSGLGTGEAVDASVADQQPYLLPGQIGPAYPDELRDDAPDGLVVARFIIDTLGKAEEPSFRIVAASNPLFARSVRTALERLRYAPARFSGRRIRVRVEQRFEFHLAGE